LVGYEECESCEAAVGLYIYNEDDVNFKDLQKFATKVGKLYPNPNPARGGDASSLSELWQRVMAEKYGAEWKNRRRAGAADEEMRKEAEERTGEPPRSSSRSLPHHTKLTQKKRKKTNMNILKLAKEKVQPTRPRLGAVMRLKDDREVVGRVSESLLGYAELGDPQRVIRPSRAEVDHPPLEDIVGPIRPSSAP
jgi:hypothetical protein